MGPFINFTNRNWPLNMIIYLLSTPMWYLFLRGNNLIQDMTKRKCNLRVLVCNNNFKLNVVDICFLFINFKFLLTRMLNIIYIKWCRMFLTFAFLLKYIIFMYIHIMLSNIILYDRIYRNTVYTTVRYGTVEWYYFL